MQPQKTSEVFEPRSIPNAARPFTLELACCGTAGRLHDDVSRDWQRVAGVPARKLFHLRGAVV